MDAVGREDLQRERTELGAAVPFSTIPSAAWDFQLGICTVVLAWEISTISPSPSVPALAAGESLPWGRYRGDRKAGVGRALCVRKASQTHF